MIRFLPFFKGIVKQRASSHDCHERAEKHSPRKSCDCPYYRCVGSAPLHLFLSNDVFNSLSSIGIRIFLKRVHGTH